MVARSPIRPSYHCRSYFEIEKVRVRRPCRPLIWIASFPATGNDPLFDLGALALPVRHFHRWVAWEGSLNSCPQLSALD